MKLFPNAEFVLEMPAPVEVVRGRVKEKLEDRPASGFWSSGKMYGRWVDDHCTMLYAHMRAEVRLSQAAEGMTRAEVRIRPRWDEAGMLIGCALMIGVPVGWGLPWMGTVIVAFAFGFLVALGCYLYAYQLESVRGDLTRVLGGGEGPSGVGG